MRRPTSLLIVGVLGLVVLVLPGGASAQTPAPVTTAPSAIAPATTVIPAPTTAPTPTTAPAPSEAAAPEAALAVGDEASYRAALTTLSADPAGPHRIDLTADIVLAGGVDPIYTGTAGLTIDGHGFTLDAGGTSRLLVVDSPTDAPLSLLALTMRGGRGTGDGGAVLVGNASPVEVVDTRFEANVATGSGGALAVPEQLLVERSDFLDNVATGGDGGAIDPTAAAGAFTIRSSIFEANRAPTGRGGAVSDLGEADEEPGVLDSTFVANEALEGGALVALARANVVNSTIVGNRASVRGGGVLALNTDIAAFVYVTITGNAAPDGANVAFDGNNLYLFFTVLAEPSGGANCSLSGGRQVTESHADDASCGGNSEGGDPLLGPLGDNGGRTPTRVPLAGSPLIDAVPQGIGFPSVPGGCSGFLGIEPYDQRGVQRPQDGDGESRLVFAQGEQVEVAEDCDIGAVEAEAFVPPATGPIAAGPAFTG